MTKTDNPALVGVHKFESAGLGKAPFRFLGVTENVFKPHPDAPAKAGGSCDYCGTGIMFEFHIESADGQRHKVGCDCIRKVVSSNCTKATLVTTDLVVPNEPAKATITLGAEYLRAIADYVMKNNEKNMGVRLEIIDELAPLRFWIRLDDGREAMGVLMPMRVK